MNNIDEAFDFITKVFTSVTALDVYFICRDYGITSEEDKEILKERLIEAGWTLNDDGSLDD